MIENYIDVNAGPVNKIDLCHNFKYSKIIKLLFKNNCERIHIYT